MYLGLSAFNLGSLIFGHQRHRLQKLNDSWPPDSIVEALTDWLGRRGSVDDEGFTALDMRSLWEVITTVDIVDRGILYGGLAHR